MGSSIAQRLMTVGHDVSVWNRNLANRKPLTDAGGKLFVSLAELVEGCEATIVMLLHDAATEAIYRGPKGIWKVLAMPTQRRFPSAGANAPLPDPNHTKPIFVVATHTTNQQQSETP